jgi:hypothetical protein
MKLWFAFSLHSGRRRLANPWNWLNNYKTTFEHGEIELHGNFLVSLCLLRLVFGARSGKVEPPIFVLFFS